MNLHTSAGWRRLCVTVLPTRFISSGRAQLFPQDLIVSLSATDISVWTTDSETRLLLSLPRDAETAVSSVRISDRLGSTGIRLERRN